MRNHPIPLSTLRIDKPCSQNWESMAGDDRRRFCAQCQHHVHNLSQLTEREIQKILNTDGRVCGMLVRDPFGRLITKPERGWRASLRRRWTTWRLGFGSALASLLTTTGFAEKSAPPAPPAATSSDSKPKPASTPKPPASTSTEEETIVLVGFVVNTAPTSKSPQASAPSDETITLPAFGEMICEKPKPPPRKKYKK
ncbi:MAG: hypothetical protein QM760_04915 [Nibricoccus sp.]